MDHQVTIDVGWKLFWLLLVAVLCWSPSVSVHVRESLARREKEGR